MNDNKRLYNKLNTIFWWTIACFPLLIAVGIILFDILNKNSTSYNYEILFSDYESFILDTFQEGFIYDLFDNLSNFMYYSFGSNSYWVSVFGFVFAWFVFTHLVHIFVDVILLLPRICQKFIERV